MVLDFDKSQTIRLRPDFARTLSVIIGSAEGDEIRSETDLRLYRLINRSALLMTPTLEQIPGGRILADVTLDRRLGLISADDLHRRNNAVCLRARHREFRERRWLDISRRRDQRNRRRAGEELRTRQIVKSGDAAGSNRRNQISFNVLTFRNRHRINPRRRLVAGRINGASFLCTVIDKQ